MTAFLANRRYGAIATCLMVLMLALTGCESGAEGGPIPTIGPIRTGGGTPGEAFVNFTASTNCAEVGEVVTFTLQIRNDATFPITLTGSPLLDIRIGPARKSLEPVQLWSESDQYPSTINPVFAPGEERTYEWRWTADGVYAPYPTADNGINVVMPFNLVGPEKNVIQGGEYRLLLGIRTLNLPMGATTCAEMRL